MLRFLSVENLGTFYFCAEGKDLRERFSGAVEAFARRNVSSPGIRSSKEVVIYSFSFASFDKWRA